jgi:hypothetical protein
MHTGCGGIVLNLSTADPEFLATAEEWIDCQGEISALIRYSRRAGAKEFEFVHSRVELHALLQRLPPATSVILFRQRQLPLRGVVDEPLAEAALAVIPDGEEFMLFSGGPGSELGGNFCAGETHQELRQLLDEHRGKWVATGLYPPWLHDTDDAIEAITPQEDGSILRGIY